MNSDNNALMFILLLVIINIFPYSLILQEYGTQTTSEVSPPIGEKAESRTPRLYGGADGSRTRDPLTASQVLIPTELQPL